MENDFFNRMCKDAINQVASGGQSWRDAPPNVLIMACFGLLTNHLSHKLTRPLWFAASSIATGVIGYLVFLTLNAIGG